MDCLNNKDYPSIYYKTNSNYKIIPRNSLEEYSDYFENLKDFSPINTIYTEEFLSTIPQEQMPNIDQYLNNNYYIGYLLDESAPKADITYTIKRIFQEKDDYKAIIVATYQNHQYVGKLSISLVDGHPKYSTLHFY